jgi:ferritin-like metal-binding protein YciE
VRFRARRAPGRQIATGADAPSSCPGYLQGNERKQGRTDMFERLNTPQEVHNFKLGAALTMEQDVLDILDDNIKHAQEPAVRRIFEEHRAETEQQARNLERAFELLGWEVDDSPCPAIRGIQAEGKANIKKTDDSLVDAVILAGATETEHHEIAVYETLIVHARAMGRQDVVALLEENLHQEQATLAKVHSAAEQVAAMTPKLPA